jgi:inorganic pyrophosphatase
MDKFTAVIETPAGSTQKYRYDPKQKSLSLVKRLPQGMTFPFDFGMLPDTLAPDGDPADVLVVSEFSTFPACHVECRIVGAMVVEQSSAAGLPPDLRNDRFIAVSTASQVYKSIQSISDFPDDLIRQVAAFFKNYLAQEDKEANITQILDAQLAKRLLEQYKTDMNERFLYEIFIPAEKDGETRHLSSHYTWLRQELVGRFGGLTIYQRSPAKGIWEPDNEARHTDDMIIYEVMADNDAPGYWRWLKAELEHRFNQQEILVRKACIDLVQ